MILYVSESLNVKRNGGSSLSGLDFLQILMTHYADLSVISNSRVKIIDSNFYKWPLSNSPTSLLARRVYNPKRGSVLRYVKAMLIWLGNQSRKKTFRLSKFYTKNEHNLVFVNSWSPIFENFIKDDTSEFSKICIVRGNPESFVWQNNETTPEEAVENAAVFLRKFDYLIFVSKVGMERWKPMLPTSIKTFYLPNSIDEQQIAKLVIQGRSVVKARLGFEKEHHHLVAIGSVQLRKGQDMLIDVAKNLAASGLTNFTIHIVGVISNSWGGTDIVSDIKASSVAKYFKFHGHRDDALDFAYAADVNLFTSRAEAFPRTVAEYMALGTSIVATDVSGVPEMLRHQENALLCPSQDSVLMAEQIEHSLSNPHKAQQRACQARHDYESKFSKACQIARAHEIFNEITKI